MKRSMKKLTNLLVWAGLALFLGSRCLGAQVQDIKFDFSKVKGTIKPLNGVNGGPLAERGAIDLSNYYAGLGIKHIRLHDVPWMFDCVVDINDIFPRFEANANDPKNYNFRATDHYINSIRLLGAEMIFRLGYSAEYKDLPPTHNVPPKDFVQWVAISTHIVMHYDQRWDKGFHHSVQYWEVWNEPDIKNFWSGTPRQYYRLYELTAKAIETVDPASKVGGPALAVHLSFLNGFLKYCESHNVPIDFVSWHMYTSEPNAVVSKAAKIRRLLNRYGFLKAENILDEWNYFTGDWRRLNTDAKYKERIFTQEIGGIPGAAFYAAILIRLQDSSVDIADYYQGTTMWWGGLFDQFGVPRKPYYAFKAFKDLLDTPQYVLVSPNGLGGLAAIAGLSPDKAQATIMISNYGTNINNYRITLRSLPWKNTTDYIEYILDRKHNLEIAERGTADAKGATLSEKVEVPSVCVIRLYPAH